jgi:hypothetical protein
MERGFKNRFQMTVGARAPQNKPFMAGERKLMDEEMLNKKKEQMQVQWTIKYKSLQAEYTTNQERMVSLRGRIRSLYRDLAIQLFVVLVCFILIRFVVSYRDDIINFAYQMYIFYDWTIRGLTIAAILFNGYMFFLKFKKLFHHMFLRSEIHYPKQQEEQTKGMLFIPSGFFEEQKCREWIAIQYETELKELRMLQPQIAECTSKNVLNVERRINAIKIFQTIGNAKE